MMLTTMRIDLGLLNMIDNMKASSLCYDLIKHHEGFRSKPYNDSGGVPTIGWGHMILPGESYAEITKEQGQKILEADVANAEYLVKSLVKVDLTQNQFDALTSFIFNTGIKQFGNSYTLSELNKGRYGVVSKRLILYSKDVYIDENGNKVVSHPKGLIRRRTNETALWDGRVTDKTQFI